MPTVSDFLNAAGTVLLCNAVIFLVGRAMRDSMKRKGQHLQAFHGWYVWVWMMAGVAVGGVFLPWQSGATINGVPIGAGFLIGWIVGFFHGAFMLDHFDEPPTQPDTKADA